MGSFLEVSFLLVFALTFCFRGLVYSQSIITKYFVLTVQGEGQCPNPSYAGSRTITSTRSQMDCSRRCNIREDCIYLAYHKRDNICHLYKSTPDKLFPTPDCKFMAVRNQDYFIQLTVFRVLVAVGGQHELIH